MAVPPIYLDECIDRRLAVRLRAWGIDVETVAEATAAGSSDEAQLLYAFSRRRVLISQNQIDFRRLHATFLRAGRPHGGIAIVPQTAPLDRLERRVRLLLDWIGTFPDPRSRLFAWTELQQRAIHGFRLPDWDERIVRDAIGWT
jgi:hypothetical protein